MKKIFVLFISLVFIVGCGGGKGSKQATQEKRDYIADGMKYLNAKDIPRAIRSFDQAIKEDPRNVEKYIALGNVYMRLGNNQRAIDTLTAGAAVDPNNGEVFYLLATCRGLRGDDEDKVLAIKSIQRSIEIFVKAKDQENFKKSVVLLKGLQAKWKAE